jgi:hypothetical protein
MPVYAKARCIACFALAVDCGPGSTNSKGSLPASGPSASTSAGSPSAGYYRTSEPFEGVARDQGFYIETPDYDANDVNASQLIARPGQEALLCYYVSLGNTAEVDIGGFQSWMSAPSGHHFGVYQVGTGTAAATTWPSGTVVECAFGEGNWLYTASTPGVTVGMVMPDHVGLPIAANAQLILNMHFVNPSSGDVYPKVRLNVLRASDVQQRAAVMVSFNTGISVPPATASGPGMQTVSGTCQAPQGAKFFSMSTDTHKHATAATVSFVSGGASTEVVHTGAATQYPSAQVKGTGTDWEHPGIAMWTAPNFLVVRAGDFFTYACSYENDDSNTTITVGHNVTSNEMCMAVGYYFPAGAADCN